jgi:hypothetical protein
VRKACAISSVVKLQTSRSFSAMLASGVSAGQQVHYKPKRRSVLKNQRLLFRADIMKSLVSARDLRIPLLCLRRRLDVLAPSAQPTGARAATKTDSGWYAI